MKTLMLALVLLLGSGASRAAEVKYYDVPKGAHPHDVAPDPKPDGPVWYTAQHHGAVYQTGPSGFGSGATSWGCAPLGTS